MNIKSKSGQDKHLNSSSKHIETLNGTTIKEENESSIESDSFKEESK